MASDALTQRLRYEKDSHQILSSVKYLCALDRRLCTYVHYTYNSSRNHSLSHWGVVPQSHVHSCVEMSGSPPATTASCSVLVRSINAGGSGGILPRRSLPTAVEIITTARFKDFVVPRLRAAPRRAKQCSRWSCVGFGNAMATSSDLVAVFSRLLQVLSAPCTLDHRTGPKSSKRSILHETIRL